MCELRALVEATERLHQRGLRPTLATVVEIRGSAYRRPGAHMIIAEGLPRYGSISGGCLEQDLAERSLDLSAPAVVTYDSSSDDDLVWGLGLGCRGIATLLLEPLGPEHPLLAVWRECLSLRQSISVATVFESTSPELPVGTFARCSGSSPLAERVMGLDLGSHRSAVYADAEVRVLVQQVSPPPRLLVCGAGIDAVPLVHLSAGLGWDTIVLDRRAARATREHFPEAHQIVVGPPSLISELGLASEDAAVVMNHHIDTDRHCLQRLLQSQVGYVGALGPRERTLHLIEDSDHRLFAPVGLDIGAESPSEVALAIIAEIRSWQSGREAGFLRNRTGPIHREVVRFVREPALA